MSSMQRTGPFQSMPPGSRPYAEGALELRSTGEHRHAVAVQCAPGLAELPEERLELPAPSPVESLPPWRVDDDEPRRVEWLEVARVRLPHLDRQARTLDVDPGREDRLGIAVARDDRRRAAAHAPPGLVAHAPERRRAGVSSKEAQRSMPSLRCTPGAWFWAISAASTASVPDPHIGSISGRVPS